MLTLIFSNTIKRSMGGVLNVVRKLENVKTKIIKLQKDTEFIKMYK